MSHFYASIQGSRGEATRQGHKSSGISSHARGWHTGIQVEGHAEVVDKFGNTQDVFRVYKTAGSANPTERTLIAEIRDEHIELKINK